jgi:hypothetical protein
MGGEKKNAFRVLVTKPEEKNHQEDLYVDRSILI